MGRYMELADKLMTLEEAVSRFVPSGSQVAIGGFTINRNPMALTYEMVRQGVKNLHLVCHSQGQSLDILIGAGCVSRVEIAYGANGRFAPTCVRFRKAAERGEIEIEDYSNSQMGLRFLAGSLGIPFMPSRSGLGTDIIAVRGFSEETRKGRKVSRKKMISTRDPFDEEGCEIVLLPALNPDVALLHAQHVGEDGTVRIKGLTFTDVEQAKAADAVIVTCEEIVPKEYIRIDPDGNSLPDFLVDAVVPVPYGAHPTACHLFYDYDPGHLNGYREAANDDEAFKEYLNRWVYSVKTRQDYFDRIGGAGLAAIRANTVVGYKPGLDRR
jgi:glutaconate CoA-transferase subunit A